MRPHLLESSSQMQEDINRFFCVQAEQRFADVEYINRCRVTSESESRGLFRWIHSRCPIIRSALSRVLTRPDSARACGVRIPTARLLVSRSGGWSQKDLTPQTKKKKIRLPKHACPSGSSLLLGLVISRRARIDRALIRVQQTCLREQLANKPLVPRNNWGPINCVSSVSGFAETMQVLQLVCKESIIYLLSTSCMLSQTSLSKHNYSRQHKSGNTTVTSRLAFCLRITCISCYSLVLLLIIKVKMKYSAFFSLILCYILRALLNFIWISHVC